MPHLAKHDQLRQVDVPRARGVALERALPADEGGFPLDPDQGAVDGIPLFVIVVAMSRHQIGFRPLRSSSQATVDPEIVGAVWLSGPSLTTKSWFVPRSLP